MTSPPLDLGARDRQRRPRAVLLFPLVFFGLVAYRGLVSIATDASAFGPPWTLAGLGGAIGTAAILIAALAVRRGTESAGAQSSAPGRTVLGARVLLVMVAIGVIILGVAVAPADEERGFVITVDAVLATALALFAWFVGDPTRESRRPT